MLRRRISTLHRWCGVAIAAYVIVLALTGSVLVWNREVDAWLNPDLLAPAAGTSTATVDEILMVGRAAVPAAGGCSIALPDRVISVYRLLCSHPRPTGEVVVEIVVSGSGAFLGHRYWDEFGLDAPVIVRTIYSLHSDLLIGPDGRTIGGLLGLVLLLMTLTGLVNWWPRKHGWRHAFRFPLKGPPKRFLFNLHRVGGAWASILLLSATGSGLYLAFPKQIDSAVGLLGPIEREPVLASPGAGPAVPNPLSAARIAVERAFPDGRITAIDPPAAAGDPISVSLVRPQDVRQVYGGTLVYVDPATARLVGTALPEDEPPAGRFLALLFPIHNGEALGTAGRIAVLVGGLAAAMLAGSGLWLWMRRRSPRRLP